METTNRQVTILQKLPPLVFLALAIAAPLGQAAPLALPPTFSDQSTKDCIGDGNHPQVRISAITRDHLKTPNGGWVPMSLGIRPLLPALMSCTAIQFQREHRIKVLIVDGFNTG